MPSDVVNPICGVQAGTRSSGIALLNSRGAFSRVLLNPTEPLRSSQTWWVLPHTTSAPEIAQKAAEIPLSGCSMVSTMFTSVYLVQKACQAELAGPADVRSITYGLALSNCVCTGGRQDSQWSRPKCYALQWAQASKPLCDRQRYVASVAFCTACKSLPTGDGQTCFWHMLFGLYWRPGRYDRPSLCSRLHL